MSQEANVNRASYDWVAFSAGQAIYKTLYSIRRERRCEFAGEGMRMFDLKRWRAMGQVKDYQLEGVNFWEKIHEYEYFIDKNTKLKDDGSGNANISARTLSKYVHPYQIVKQNNDMWDGYTFYQAHYLSPISIIELQLCSPTNDKDNSNLYQNPGWSTTANEHAKNQDLSYHKLCLAPALDVQSRGYPIYGYSRTCILLSFPSVLFKPFGRLGFEVRMCQSYLSI